MKDYFSAIPKAATIATVSRLPAEFKYTLNCYASCACNRYRGATLGGHSFLLRWGALQHFKLHEKWRWWRVEEQQLVRPKNWNENIIPFTTLCNWSKVASSYPEIRARTSSQTNNMAVAFRSTSMVWSGFLSFFTCNMHTFVNCSDIFQELVGNILSPIWFRMPLCLRPINMCHWPVRNALWIMHTEKGGQVMFVRIAISTIHTWLAIVSELRVVKIVSQYYDCMLALQGEPLCTLPKVILLNFR